MRVGFSGKQQQPPWETCYGCKFGPPKSLRQTLGGGARPPVSQPSGDARVCPGQRRRLRGLPTPGNTAPRSSAASRLDKPLPPALPTVSPPRTSAPAGTTVKGLQGMCTGMASEGHALSVTNSVQCKPYTFPTCMCGDQDDTHVWMTASLENAVAILTEMSFTLRLVTRW